MTLYDAHKLACGRVVGSTEKGVKVTTGFVRHTLDRVNGTTVITTEGNATFCLRPKL